MLVLLLLVIIFMSVYTYKCVGNDIVHPSVIVLLSTMFSVISATYNCEKWGIEFSPLTFSIIFISLYCISTIGIICNCRIFGSKNCYEPQKFFEVFLFKKQTMIFINIIIVVSALWYYYVIFRATGGGTLFEMVSAFRMIHSYGIESEYIYEMPSILNQMLKVTKVFAYLFTLLFINNLVVAKKLYWRYLLPVLLFCLQTLMGGDRIYCVILLGTAVIIYCIICNKLHYLKKGKSIKLLSMLIVSLISIMFLFGSIRNVIGHSQSNEYEDVLSYATRYAGGSIQLLNLYLKDPYVKSDDDWGKETFSSIHKTIMSIKGDKTPKRHLEFRESNGIVIGNIYTAIRKYYNDFGIWGIIILSSIFSAFYSCFYKLIKNDNKTLVSYKLFVYSFIMHCTYYYPLDDLFFSGVLSVNYFSSFVYMWLIYYFFIVKKFGVEIIYYEKL